jgi:hypothetical protein
VNNWIISVNLILNYGGNIMTDTDTNEIKYDENQIRALMSDKIPEMSKYMQFIGTFTLVVGIVYCVTIIGAIFGIPLYYMGRRLRESAQAFLNYRRSDSKQDLYNAIEKQSRAFFIQYIFAIIGLVFMGLYIIILIILLASGAF